MAKGPIITPDVLELIAEVHLQHISWRAKEVRQEVNTRLRRENSHVDPEWPGLSAVQKELTKIREINDARTPESKRLDESWGTYSLAKYPIPPEALPSVLQVWVYVREKLDEPFTIREALWVSRLYAATKDIATLAEFAMHHSLGERIRELSEFGRKHALSTDFGDLELFSQVTGQEITPALESKVYGVVRDEWLFWLRDMSVYNLHGINQMLENGYTKEEVKRIIEKEANKPYKSPERTPNEIRDEWKDSKRIADEYEKEVQNERSHNQEG